MPATASSRSASAKTRPAFLPPSSKETGASRAAAARMIAVPVRDAPVKATASTPGCSVSHWPAESGPRPCTRLKTPAGTPASAITSASRQAVPGVSSDGLATTVLPVARAGATFQVSSSSGRFHGETTATTPSGLRTV